MNDTDLENGFDAELDEALAQFARSSRTPSLPDEVAALPWTVQLDHPRGGAADLFGRLRSGFGDVRRTSSALARVGATLAVAGAFLLLVGQGRTGGAGAQNLMPPPPPTARPSGAVAAPTGPQIVVVQASGVVDDVMADYVSGAIRKAESDGAVAVIIQLDTLGGSGSAMVRIDAALNARIPTVVWVGPTGAKAASAGTFITLSANLAYMAPGTNIGAASPVAAGGQDIATVYGDTAAQKTLKDAVAMMRSIAELRHPQAVAWAVSTVQSAESYTPQEALDAHGIDGIATSLDEVIAQIDGQTVTTSAGPVVIHSKDAATVMIGEDPIQAFLHMLDDPNIAFILLVVGVLCILIEFFQPTLLMGLLGALSLALSFYGSGSLPLNLLGVVLVVIGIVMLVLEPAIPSHGLLTVGGIATFVVGAVAFYGSPGPYLPSVSVAWPIIAVMAGAAFAYGLVLVRTAIQIRRFVPAPGSGMIGTVSVISEIGVVQADLAPLGTVYVGRESWTARLDDGGSAARGTQVRVLRQEGLTLIVERVE
jgi:membrane-bound serine protease (ClpP class)